MKTKVILGALVLTASVSGIAIACSGVLPLPIPPVPISISQTDLAIATLQGYSANAGYAAAMKKIDTLGRAAVGKSAWHSNSYAGEITYSVTLAGVTGANTMYVEKGCDRDFIDNAPRTGGGGGGGGGSISQNGCDSPAGTYGIIGYVETSVPWSTCTPDGCSSGTYHEYELQYGFMSGVC